MYTTSRAIKTFTLVAGELSKVALAFASAATVCFLRAERDKDADPDAVQEKLRSVISENAGRSQTFRFIAQGRKLARKLAADFPDANGAPDGIVHNVLDAATPDDAIMVVSDYLQKQTVTSYDKLDVYLGATPRSQRMQAAAKRDEPRVRHASTEAIVATFEDADPPRADELFSELIGAAPLSILERWQELLAEEITSRSRRRRGRASGMSDRSKTNAGAALQ